MVRHNSLVCKLKGTNVSALVCLVIFHLANFILRLPLNIEASPSPEQNEAGLTKVQGAYTGSVWKLFSGLLPFLPVCFHLSSFLLTDLASFH